MKAIITVGLPASGKSTWAAKFIQDNPSYLQIERDHFRALMYSNWPDYKPKKSTETLITEMCQETAKDCAKAKQSIVVSDTNLNPQTLMNWELDLQNLGYSVEIKYFTDVPYKEILKRNRKRDAYVPEWVIENMAKKNLDLFPWAHEEFSIPKSGVFVPDPKNLNCIIVDVDGTIADATACKRSMYDMTRVHEDDPIHIVIDTVKAIAKARDATIIIVSAREGSEIGRKLTKDWLLEHFPQYDYLYMREEGDFRKDCLVKEELFRKFIAPWYNPIAVFDDRMQVVKIWANLGLHVFQCYQPGKPDNNF